MLRQLYDLQIIIAKSNKPIISISNGKAYNSGASMLASTSLPLVTPHAEARFNEVSFGFVPHSGGIYHLSRLENNIGTFLALTGMPLKGADIIHSGLADA
jgi:enoyl-CoA hydratase